MKKKLRGRVTFMVEYDLIEVEGLTAEDVLDKCVNEMEASFNKSKEEEPTYNYKTVVIRKEVVST